MPARPSPPRSRPAARSGALFVVLRPVPRPPAPDRRPRRRRPVAAASPVPTAAPTATARPRPPARPPPRPSRSPLTDDEGTAVTLNAAPQKIVSLTPAVTETLFAVGAGDRVVATDDSSDYPAEAKPLPDVVTFGTVDVEKIVSLDPGPRHRRWRRVHVGRVDRPAARAQDPGPRRLERHARPDLHGHRARRDRRRRDRRRDRPDRRRCARTWPPIATAAQAESAKAAEAEAARLLRRRLHRRDRPDLRPGQGLVPRRDARACSGST